MLDPNLLNIPNMRDAIVSHDIATVYRILTRHGILQRDIAEMTGQSQSEVSEILSGRRVSSYALLERIAAGLGIPRELMGLSYGPLRGPADGSRRGYAGGEDEHGAVSEEVREEMKRRALLAIAGVSLFGAPILGEVLREQLIGTPGPPTPLPARLGISDVEAIRSLTEQLRGVARTYGGCADVVTGVAHRSLQLMSIPSSEEVHSELGSALADLSILAGWCCVDSGHHDNARSHFATAMELGKTADDPEVIASAFRHAGIQMVDADAYNDGLKAYQLGRMALGSDSAEGRRSGVSFAQQWLAGESAIPLAAMGYRDDAIREISVAREQPMPTRFDDADMDYLTSAVYRRLGALDTAESFATSSVRKWARENASRRDSVNADINLATIHVMTGESDGAVLAHRAIITVAGLHSTRARVVNMSRLVDALEDRPSSDNRQLVALARRLSTV